MEKRIARLLETNFSEKEYQLLKKLKTPRKIQDFLDTLRINFEPDGDTVLSPRIVLKERRCHCAEGAVLAALVLRLHGYPPLVLDLTASKADFDHVVAVFQADGKWGAISKTNYAALRYREPVYTSIRELAMSYFHEYLDKQGRKSLRSFSRVVNLKRFDHRGWMTTLEEVDYIPAYLVDVQHFPILKRKQIRTLRPANKIEVTAGNLTEWPCPRRNSH